jgi:hypothetical protein
LAPSVGYGGSAAPRRRMAVLGHRELARLIPYGRPRCRVSGARARRAWALALPTIELQDSDGCPGYEGLLPGLRRLAREAGANLELRRIGTAEHAAAQRFLVSPPDNHRLDSNRTGERGRERDTGARISNALEGQSRAADHKPLTSALRFRQSPAPTHRIPQEPPHDQPLDFHPSPGADNDAEGQARQEARAAAMAPGR